jgi:hypothetical protein
MGCIVWVQQVDRNGQAGLGFTKNWRAGQKITVSSKTICKVAFLITKVGNPTGTAYVTIRKVSDDSVIEMSTDTLDVSTITPDPIYTFYEYIFDSELNEAVRFSLQYDGGTSSDFIRLGVYTSDAIIGIFTKYNGSEWIDESDNEACIKVYEEEYEPVTYKYRVPIIRARMQPKAWAELNRSGIIGLRRPRIMFADQQKAKGVHN